MRKLSPIDEAIILFEKFLSGRESSQEMFEILERFERSKKAKKAGALFNRAAVDITDGYFLLGVSRTEAWLKVVEKAKNEHPATQSTKQREKLRKTALAAYNKATNSDYPDVGLSLEEIAKAASGLCKELGKIRTGALYSSSGYVPGHYS